ncbi:hypothetical protein NHX12_005849 [Muraenolepis orangiensis]|uniref:Uncharacterized protein n=1 Tax=Muraenolepis orangiensis TaxID=630683 RepID=A0A9Q0ICK4_9TELE|nr:hypothetical protein NHX12_005849 [Muraenolepis orangiensis]
MFIRALTLWMVHVFMLCSGANLKIGIPENYDGIFPWYLSKLPSLDTNYSELQIRGDDEGIFGVDAAFLYALKPLDREKQPSYSLQVRLMSSYSLQVRLMSSYSLQVRLMSSYSLQVRLMSSYSLQVRLMSS